MSRRLKMFFAVQVAIPAGLLTARALTGEVGWYGWGWQMFS